MLNHLKSLLIQKQNDTFANVKKQNYKKNMQNNFTSIKYTCTRHYVNKPLEDYIQPSKRNRCSNYDITKSGTDGYRNFTKKMLKNGEIVSEILREVFVKTDFTLPKALKFFIV